MAELIEIPKANEEHDNFPCWTSVVDPNRKEIRPLIRCKCGVWTDISNHHVHKDGRVTASYYHAQEGGCGWHVYLKLKDYNGSEFI